MKFNIVCFTHVGSSRSRNQDRILVQGRIFAEEVHSFPNESSCYALVADGIGGNPSGDVAAQFVLEQFQQQYDTGFPPSPDKIAPILHFINQQLLEFGRNHPEHRGLGTTLVGLIIVNGQFSLFQAGDSVAWLLRNDLFLKLTEDQVVNPDVPNSPLISYFGGLEDTLEIKFNDMLREILPGDIFVLASDGLFKALPAKQVKVILSNSTSLLDRANFMLQKALEYGAEDNISCILIEVGE
ncbi:MAG: serine/threonine-protein phosphatase [candidate division KSB1 bacterium]|nr:serine/threonine-protein phosphatase [candidate division KSB1 bacterium]MDZ7342500.1 serine/threonine-protein phosphatase [candidate division KSB1 bacterium]